MTLDFRISGLAQEAQKVLSQEWLFFIETFTNIVGVSALAIEKIVVTDKENYGSAIHELCPGEKFTNNNNLIGFGKTLPRLNSLGQVVSDIVLRIESMSVLHDAVRAKTHLETLPPDLQLLAYIVAHELGHCRDFAERPLGVGSTSRMIAGLKIQAWAEVQSSIIVCEYAACVFSATFVSEALLKYQFENDADSVRNFLEKVQEKRRAYSDKSELLRLANDACAAFWFVIIQAAKLFAQRLGNPSLRSVELDWAMWFDSEAATILPRLEESLCNAWKQYPTCENQFLNDCLPIWTELAEAEGFRFVKDDQKGDGIFFDIWNIRDSMQGIPPPLPRYK